LFIVLSFKFRPKLNYRAGFSVILLGDFFKERPLLFPPLLISQLIALKKLPDHLAGVHIV
jgi:hypothetical protein